jgi:hypothetical protein
MNTSRGKNQKYIYKLQDTREKEHLLSFHTSKGLKACDLKEQSNEKVCAILIWNVCFGL